MANDRDSPPDPGGQQIAPTQTDAFDILGHELRLRTVELLGTRQRANAWRPVPMEFEELRRAVDSSDSGRFNYHLDKLLGTYVEQTDDGYILSPAGFEVSSAVLRGSYAGVSVGPLRGSLGDCPMCTAEVTGVYEDGLLYVLCPEHGVVFGNTVPPAAAVDRDIEEIATTAIRDARRDVERARNGTCPECVGPIETTIADSGGSPDELTPVDGDSGPVRAEFDCQRCRLSFDSELYLAVLDHPAVVAFYHDHDVDIRPDSHVEPDNVSDTVVSGEPVRARVRFRTNSERLDVALDSQGTVVDTERS